MSFLHFAMSWLTGCRSDDVFGGRDSISMHKGFEMARSITNNKGLICSSWGISSPNIKQEVNNYEAKLLILPEYE